MWTELEAPAGGKSGFAVVPAADAGIRFTNRLGEWDAAANRVLEGGSGVAAGDYDGDGRVDLFFASLSGECRLYRNLGHWRFEDVTVASGIITSNRICRGCVFADIDGDGRLDLLVSTAGKGVLVFRNVGGGRFEDFTQQAGTATPFGATTLALADVDGNGTLDLYVTHYRVEDIRDRGTVDLRKVNGQIVVPPQLRDRLVMVGGVLQEYGEPDLLFLNLGEGHFKPVSWIEGRFLDESGKPLTRAPFDWGLTASFRDVNGDGAPDLYVCNDYWTPDRFWLNDGKGRFQAAPAHTLRHTSASSMGVDFADIDRDGHVDFLVVDMLSRNPIMRKRQLPGSFPDPAAVSDPRGRPLVNRNTLQHSRGDGTYEEVADFSGVAASDWSWQPLFLDVNLDGYEDLVIATGNPRDVNDRDANERIQQLQHPWNRTNGMVVFEGREVPFSQAFTTERMRHNRIYPPLAGAVVAFENLGSMRFRDVTQQWGLDVPAVHQGIILADIDNDGDMDVVTTGVGGSPILFRNSTIRERIAVELRGRAPNVQGVGARVELVGGPVPRQSQEIVAGGRYLSGCQARLSFAAAAPTPGPLRLEVRWRSGSRSVVPDVRPGRLYEIQEPLGFPEAIAPQEAGPTGTLFEDLSHLLPPDTHPHAPLAASSLQSPFVPNPDRLGPAVAIADVDGDGVEEMIVGAGPGESESHVFFLPMSRESKPDRTRVVTLPTGGGAVGALVAGVFPSGARQILLAAEPRELAPRTSSAVLAFGVRPPVDSLQCVSVPGLAPSAMAVGDLTGSGRLDLFVAGGLSSGRYPEGEGVRVYHPVTGGWELDVQNSAALSAVGRVNAIACTDLDADGWPDVVLASEWGALWVFGNRGGRLFDKTAKLGLDGLTGWWTTLAVGDFDADGNMDLVAGNWGWNLPVSASPDHPLVMHAGDLAGRGEWNVIVVETLRGETTPIVRQGLPDLLPLFPSLRERYATHEAFAGASVQEALGDFLARGRQWAVRELSTLVLLNRGGRFERRPLPYAAQMAPVFGIGVADFDGDGREDLLLAQNHFGMPLSQARLDSGQGLLLRGDGAGGFEPVPARASGVLVWGEGRGVAVGDIDGDGRVDALISQFEGPLVFARNRMGKTGLRVRLEGPVGNPQGVGAVVRWVDPAGDPVGPAHVVSGGGAQRGQSSPLVVMHPCSGAGSELSVRWPGGSQSRAAVPGGAHEVRIRSVAYPPQATLSPSRQP